MKKVISLLFILLSLNLAACGGNSKASQKTESETSDSKLSESPDSKPSDEPEVSDEKLGEFNKNCTLDETVMVDEDGVKITATGLNYNDYSAELELTIENNSGKDLSFVCGSMAHSCNSVNGYMVNDGYMNCDVANGKKANEKISFSYEGLMLYGINEIADIEIDFSMADDDYNRVYSGPRQVKTSAFDAHDYSKNCYRDTITSQAAMNTYDYDIACFSQDVLYDVNGVKLLSSGIMINKDGENALLLELENTTNDTVYVSTSDIAINDLIVKSSTWSSNAINPGKQCIIILETSSVLDAEYRSIYGVKDIGTVSLSLSQQNSDGNDIADKTSIEVVVPGVNAEFDSTGEEVYNKNGLRILSKTVFEDPSENSSDMYVLLLAENKSGKTLSIDDVHDSLSVNGFMTDYFFYSKELSDGKYAVLEIKLKESSLEDNKISNASEVKEVDVGLKIKEDGNTIDEPSLKISFN